MPRGSQFVGASPDRRRICGVERSASERRRQTLLFCFFFLAALGQVFSAVQFIFERQLAGRSGSFPLWVQLVLLLSIVEFGFAISLIRVLDHSALWSLTLLSLGVAMNYAFLLALLLFGRFGVVLASLELAGDAPHWASSWICSAVILLHGLFAWVAGRTSLQWRAELP